VAKTERETESSYEYKCPVCRNEVKTTRKTNIECPNCKFVWDNNPPKTEEEAKEFRKAMQEHRKKWKKRF